MRRLLIAAILAIGTHGVLFLVTRSWVLCRITPPKWSVRPVAVELVGISNVRVRHPKPRSSAGLAKKPHRHRPKLHHLKKVPKATPKRIVRKIRPSKPAPKRARVITKKQLHMPKPLFPQAHLQRKKVPSITVANNKSAETTAKPKAKPQVDHKAIMSSESNNVPPKSDKTWSDIPEDILSEAAPQTKLASLPQGNANSVKEEALVEAKPSYLENSPPQYPTVAKRRGYEGTVTLKVLVTKEGKVEKLRVFRSSGHKILDTAAVKAVKNWTFQPGRRGSKPIDMWVKVPIRFVLR